MSHREMDRANEALREARADYEAAETNLAIARANLTRAQRRADGLFRLMAERSPQVGAVPHD